MELDQQRDIIPINDSRANNPLESRDGQTDERHMLTTRLMRPTQRPPGHLFAVSGFCTNSTGKYLAPAERSITLERQRLPRGALRLANICLLQTEIWAALKRGRTFNTAFIFAGLSLGLPLNNPVLVWLQVSLTSHS